MKMSSSDEFPVGELANIPTAFVRLLCLFFVLRNAIDKSPYVQAVLQQAIGEQLREQYPSSQHPLSSNLMKVDLDVLPFFKFAIRDWHLDHWDPRRHGLGHYISRAARFCN
jgi:hypothetical protein